VCPLEKGRGEKGSFADMNHEEAKSVVPASYGVTDMRGQMYRAKRLMPEVEVQSFLRTHKVAHVGTVDAQGWPYVVPLVYIYEGGDILYLHTGDHQGHFLTNVQRNPRICVEVGEMGPVHRGKPYACNSALVYTSVIVFGGVRLIEDRAKKSWFFDRLMSKYGEAGWTFEPGYPHINRIILYEQKMEIVTGKHSEGLYH
jgi:uncharacterized protein